MNRAADLLKTGRLRSGLTQAALARLAEMPQSVISEYETGRREPSFAAVDRLLRAAGLVLELAPRTPEDTRALGRVLSRASELHRVLRPLGAGRIRVFGSVARGDDTASSDVDLVVNTAGPVGIIDLIRMRDEAERVLGRTVDLVPADGLKPEVQAAIDAEAVDL